MQGLDNLEKYAIEIGCLCTKDEPMSKHTSFHIGGKADLMLTPQNESTLSSIISACKKWDIPYYIFGNGSNILVSDNGIRGAVILTTAFSQIELVDSYTIKCGAGVKNSQLCSFALEHGLSGFEFLWGIPGTVGGAAYMNAGAYGGEFKDVYLSSDYVDESGEIGTISKDDIDYSYRHSAYCDRNCVITSITVSGTPSDMHEIRVKMDDLMNRRKTKQPLEYPSAGSVFKRPEGYFAAALIEECGLKGKRVGGAMVSEKHSGFIVNVDNATASDVKILIEQIKQEVFLQKDVNLECEIKMIG